MTATITLSGLDKAYGATPVLRDLSLTVPAGSLTALLGPSGSGKSTILKLIAGIEQPDRGDIAIDGRSIVAVPAHRRNAVLMFQDAYLFPFLNVADNIAFGLRARRTPRRQIAAEVRRILELVELPGIERRFPRELSGGQQQRVALARALVVQPQVLMLDEPLSNLDPAIRATLQDVIRRLQHELGMTMLLVTHDRSEAIALADRIALLIDGRIAAEASPEALFTRPPTRAAAEFIGISTFLPGEHAGDRLHTALGTFAVAAIAQAPRQATFAIRPEHLRFGLADASNSVAGVIRDRVYHGEWIEYSVAAAGQILRCKSYDLRLRAPGDAVWIEFPREHLFPLND